jgi:hypothetical protein
MKKVQCDYKECSHYRKHWCDPQKERGVQIVEVPDDFQGKAYCSMTCAVLDGGISLKGCTSSVGSEGETQLPKEI